MKKQIICIMFGLLLMSSTIACSSQTTPQTNSQSDTSLSNETTSTTNIVGVAEYNGDGSETITEEQIREQFLIYEKYGMTYNATKNELSYSGKLVRWFEDYYPLGENDKAGIDFFNEQGIVDVYAIRDFTTFEKDSDGAIDPRGKLVGLKEFTQKEFDVRDVDAIKNPTSSSASSGEPLSSAEVNTMLSEYKDFGVTYDEKTNQWFFNGEKVRYFRDVLTSNGESLNSGKFHGTLRTLESGNGNIDIYSIRDFDNPNAEGNGTLTGIKAYSQKEFDEHTNSNSDNYGTSATSN